MALKLKPLDDHIVVKSLEIEETTEGGIVIPDTAKEKSQKGKVLAVGEGKLLKDGKRLAPSVSVGDIVLFGKYAGTEIKIEGEEFSIMRESDVLAKLIEEKSKKK
ncbi:MAG: co-chaperone GroES [Planctomycetota bacterium]